MIFAEYRKIAMDGLWRNNQALVALFGLCPLLAVSDSLVKSLGLGLATMTASVVSNGIVSLIRRYLSHEIRLLVFVLVIATNVTLIELLMRAYFHELYRMLDIFVPLIVTNCAIIGRAEAFASKASLDRALLDAFFTGLGMTMVLALLGGMREVMGTGVLFRQAEFLFGESAKAWTVRIFDDGQGLLLATLPPGAFIGLGLLIAVKNLLDARGRRRRISLVTGLPADATRNSVPTEP